MPDNVSVSPLVRESIKRILDYNWEDEERDYNAQFDANEEFPAHHIFVALMNVRYWLDSIPEEAT